MCTVELIMKRQLRKYLINLVSNLGQKFCCILIPFLCFSCTSNENSVKEISAVNSFKSNCKVKLLFNGRNALLHRIQLIRSAKESIDLQTFIWTDDDCGRIMMNELVNAAKRGVKVRILCDHLFSSQDVTGLAAVSQTKNLEIKIYNPAGDRIKPDTLKLLIETIGDFHKVNQRMHNKLFLVDGIEGVCGGRNIENTYFDNSTGLNFKDLDIAMNGPVTESMKNSFEKFWNSPLSIPLTSLKDVAAQLDNKLKVNFELSKNELYKNLPALLKSYDRQKGYFKVEKIAFFSDEPGKNDAKNYSGSSLLNDFIISTLSKANKRIWIQSPYLVLSTKAQKSFADIRNKNKSLEIKISTNSLAATDSWPTYAFLYRQKKMLINDLGFQIYEYNPLPADYMEVLPNYSQLLHQKSGIEKLGEEERMNGKVSLYPRICIHSKCMLIDEDISFVGSYNMDPRSANLNTELSAVIIDDNFNKILAKHIEGDMSAKNSWVVARRKTIVGLKQINDLISSVSKLGVTLTGFDLWPRRFTSCFQLKAGAQEVNPNHEDFYKNYYSVGNFPRVPVLREKEILTRFFKAFGLVLKPIL